MSVIDHEDNAVLFLAPDVAPGMIYKSIMMRDGSWTPPQQTGLRSYGLPIGAVSLRYGNSSAIAVAYNEHGQAQKLVLALSLDAGKTFPFKKALEDGLPDDSFGSPAMWQTEDGLLHIVYGYLGQTIKYRRVTVGWIKLNASCHL